MRTHSCSAWMASSGSERFGGILRSLWDPVMARMRRLVFGLPGTTAGPESPPVSNDCLLSKVRPPLRSLRWHSKQYSERIGRICFSKNSIDASAESNGRNAKAMPNVMTMTISNTGLRGRMDCNRDGAQRRGKRQPRSHPFTSA